LETVRRWAVSGSSLQSRLWWPGCAPHLGNDNEGSRRNAWSRIREARIRFSISLPSRTGLSADQGRFIQDALNEEEKDKGSDARQKLQLALMAGPQLDDTLAALSFLKTRAGVDSHRIAVIGHSFGGQLTILDAEHDRDLRAVVTFGAAANSWAKTPELRSRLLTAIDNVAVPVMLIHAANDYDTSPGRDLATELQRHQKRHILKIYPAVGETPDDGHSQVYRAVPQWETDVFGFLDANLRP